MENDTNFASAVIRDGKRGRPRKEPHKTLTVRMRNRRHEQMVDYCVQHGVSQREFIEQAAHPLIMDGAFAALVRLRRRHPSKFDAENQQTNFVTLRMNRRLAPAVVAYCIDRDISQVEFLELAIETLTRNAQFAQRMKLRRVQLLEQRNSYYSSK